MARFYLSLAFVDGVLLSRVTGTQNWSEPLLFHPLFAYCDKSKCLQWKGPCRVATLTCWFTQSFKLLLTKIVFKVALKTGNCHIWEKIIKYKASIITKTRKTLTNHWWGFLLLVWLNEILVKLHPKLKHRKKEVIKIVQFNPNICCVLTHNPSRPMV